MPAEMSVADRPIRLDFDLQVLSMDKATGIVNFALRLDPDRYSEATLDDGTRAWYDRFDDLYITESAIEDLAALQLPGSPIGLQLQKAGRLDVYLDRCRARIVAALEGAPSSAECADMSEEWLRSRADDELGFAVLSVDLVGSTRLSQELDCSSYARLQIILQNELSALVPLFGGHVLKYTGDGLLAYFPEPSFIIQNDLACECALYMQAVVAHALNPLFSHVGLPTIEVRIGIDAGEAAVVILGDPQTKRHADLIGAVIGLATKIEKCAGKGGLAVGDACWRSLHTSWREHCRPLAVPREWPYRAGDRSPYGVFTLDLAALEKEALEGARINRVVSPPENFTFLYSDRPRRQSCGD
jgi:class 3 adenylate cyclase